MSTSPNPDPVADFDWHWPRRIDRALLDALFTLAFIGEAANIVLLGPNGLGKERAASKDARPSGRLSFFTVFAWFLIPANT
jgi:hypothetical protein